MLVEVEQIGIGCCCLILYIIALAEYAESERAKRVGREGVVVTKYRRRRRLFMSMLMSMSMSVSVIAVEFGSCYLVGYCDV